MLDLLNLDKSLFTTRVLRILDEERSIDFHELLSTWNHCILTEASLIIFAFDLYDVDGNGALELDEVEHMCKDIYGAGFQTHHLAGQILDRIARMRNSRFGTGEISVERFAVFAQTHPALLYPAFILQSRLQSAVCGAAFWRRLADKRVVLASRSRCATSCAAARMRSPNARA